MFTSNPGLTHIESSSDARAAFTTGVAAGTAWLFTRPEWKDLLDFLFIDEAGQVPLANAVAMARWRPSQQSGVIGILIHVQTQCITAPPTDTNSVDVSESALTFW